MSDDAVKIDQSFRRRLAGGAFCWVIIGVAQWMASKHIDWYPSLIAAFALATAVVTSVLVIKPSNGFAYRWGGTLAVGTLALRAVTIIEAELRVDSPDFIWVCLNQIAITALLAGTYAWSWLHEVKAWHRAHQALDA